MALPLELRALTDEEQRKVARRARAESAPVRQARRARISQLAAEGLTVAVIAKQLDLSDKAVRGRLTRFAAEGVAGVDDAPRSGRPRTYDEQTYSRVIAKARALPPKPQDREAPPTCHWTLDRLQSELSKEGLPIKRSQIRRILQAEQITWQQPRTWRESDDPDFAEKRAHVLGSTPTRRRTAQ
jgi:transposase